MPRLVPPLLPLILASVLLGAPACAPAVSEAAWPEGTVLAVDRHPILPDEVDRIAGWIAAIEPASTPLHLRRLALSNVVFPCRAARTLAGERWQTALGEAERTRERLLERAATGDEPQAEGGHAPEPRVMELTGSWQAIGLETFGAALEAGPERWSTVYESAGCFHVVRLERTAEERGALVVSRLDFRYLTEAEADEIEDALDRATLTILDEAWREAVPLSWVYRMRGGTS